ncbi:hypothetical protein A2U01_0104704, partial [Trifolium medium]|nr:hypothetical protein [Trifolium medium]
LRIVKDPTVLRIKGLEGIKLEISLLATDVVKKGIMPVSVEIQGLLATTVRNQVTLPETAVPQKQHHLGL